MNLLITGACGFVGNALARALRAAHPDWTLVGFDNFSRPGSETNRARLQALGVRLVHGDLRMASDVEALPAAEWVIDAAANPSVQAGFDGGSSSRQIVEHNLGASINLLEYCRRHNSGLILISTSRVYSIPPLSALPLEAAGERFHVRGGGSWPGGLSERGIGEDFSVEPPVSLYGATKLASETLALEYAANYGFPVWINRCGVLAGAGQFGRPDQGIVAWWIHRYRRRQPLRYIGFGGEGRQVRDALHPSDLLALILRQIRRGTSVEGRRLFNAGGSAGNSFSLAELHRWCGERFGFAHPVIAPEAASRRFDLPWIVMDNARAEEEFHWTPQTPLSAIFEEVALHAEQHPNWLQISAPFA